MSFNTKKCMVMHYGERNKENPYYMAGEKLQATKEERGIRGLMSKTLTGSAVRQCSNDNEYHAWAADKSLPL
jgi:hypothetical protein